MSTAEDLLASIDNMSAAKPVATRVVQACNDENSSAASLASLVMVDTVLSTRVLKLANSAFYGLGKRVASVQFAISMLGFDTVRGMAALSLAGGDEESVPEHFWYRTRLTACGAAVLAPSFGSNTKEAMCGGLVISIGEAVMLQNDREHYLNLLEEARGNHRRAQLEAEEARYGISSSTLTAEALETWNFPTDMVESARQLDSAMGTVGAPTLLLRTAVEVRRRAEGTTVRSDALTLSQGRVTEDRLRSAAATATNEAAASW